MFDNAQNPHGSPITLHESTGAVTEATGMAQTLMVQPPARQSQWPCLRSRHRGTASCRTRTATTKWRTSGRWTCSLQGCRVARSIVETISRRALHRCNHLFIQEDIRATRFSDSNPPALSVHSDINPKKQAVILNFPNSGTWPRALRNPRGDSKLIANQI